MRFVARLLELKPELTPAAAVMVAIEAFDKSSELDPVKEAEIYADASAKTMKQKHRRPRRRSGD